MPAPLLNDTFLRACLRQPTDYTPVWLMRQAGRYLPEYKATRATRRQLHGPGDEPALRHRGDAAAAGALCAGRGDPVLRHPHRARRDGPGPVLRAAARARASRTRCATKRPSPALAVPDMDKLRYVFDAVASIRKALAGRVPLIGFSGSPWTLACYMVEGGGSDDYRLVKTLMYSRPDLMQRILDINAQAVAAYLNAQIEAGAQAVMIFDSWGGVLADGAFQRFSLHYTRQVVQQLQRERDGRRVPCIVFTKGGGPWLQQIAGVGADVVGLDWTVNLGAARTAVGDQRRVAGQSGPERAVRPARRGACAGHHHARQLRRAAACRRSLGRPCLQPRPWHQPAHAARACRGPGRRGAQPLAQTTRGRALGLPRAGWRHLAPRPTWRRMPVSERSGIDLSPKFMLQRNPAAGRRSGHPDLP